MKTIKYFDALQRFLETLPRECEEVFSNNTVVKFAPKTATYNVRMAYTATATMVILTFSTAYSYPCIFAGSNIDACIRQAKIHYSVAKKF